MYRVLAFVRKLDELALEKMGKKLVWLHKDELLALRDSLPRDDVDVTRSISAMSISDIWCLLDVMTIDVSKSLLLLHYDETAFRTNSYFRNISEDRVFRAYEGILRECRGIVIDTSEFAVALLPFSKFYVWGSVDDVLIKEMLHHAELSKAAIDVSEKKDGSPVYATCYRDDFIVTLGNRFASRDERTAFLANQNDHMRFLADFSGETAMFVHVKSSAPELVYCPKKERGYYLVGMRGHSDGELASYWKLARRVSDYDVNVTRYCGDMDWPDVVAQVNSATIKQGKGYVVYINGFLVSVTLNAYLDALRKFAESSWRENLINAMMKGDYKNFLGSAPRWLRPDIKSLHTELEEYEKGMSALLDSYVEKWQNFDGSINSIVDFMSDIPASLKGVITRVINTKYEEGSDPKINWFKMNFRDDSLYRLSLDQIRKYEEELLS